MVYNSPKPSSYTFIVIIVKVKGKELENMLLEIDHRHELAYLVLIIHYYQIIAAANKI